MFFFVAGKKRRENATMTRAGRRKQRETRRNEAQRGATRRNKRERRIDTENSRPRIQDQEFKTKRWRPRNCDVCTAGAVRKVRCGAKSAVRCEKCGAVLFEKCGAVRCEKCGVNNAVRCLCRPHSEKRNRRLVHARSHVLENCTSTRALLSRTKRRIIKKHCPCH